MSTFGALDECRHTQIPLRLMHSLVARDQQFDWTHRFYHSNCWVAIAARHLFDELLLTTDPVEFAVGTHFVFETGLTNLQFIGLAAVADQVRDELFASMLTSIQTDEARHAQIGAEVLRKLCQHDRAYAQQLADKWFWRSWLLFAVVTGFTMDYLTPLEKRKSSFKEFVEEWIVGQYLDTLHDLGLERPYYWDTFRQSLDYYHHMVYASAYTYRATVWFDLVVPGPAERAWLREKYPNSWSDFEPVWEQVAASWKASGPGLDLCMYSTAIVGFCNLCQVVLCGGTPTHNTAQVVETTRGNRVFCSEPCRRIYEREPDKYAQHLGLVDRVLAGQAPANLVELLTAYCGLPEGEWGKDAYRGRYEWLFGGERRC
jgi:toluene monooxygenase system protein A